MPVPVLSKRDKRRGMLFDKVNEMVDYFMTNQYDFYFAQLSALQCDMNLIHRSDPFESGPLDSSPETVSILVDEVRKETTRNRPIAAEAEETFAAMKGRFYSQYADEINAAIERRDAELTMAYEQYNHGVEELHRTNQYKVQLAQQEHRLLLNTVRERLIQTVTTKKARLLREKEQLDIADSNALLLNPNQFSLGNPASPGGPQNSRKTRHTRLRPTDGDDAGAAGAAAIQEGNKRKRKAAAEDNDNESPAPNGRLGENRAGALFRDARAKIIHSQFEAPLYSIDRLFTEKELALNLSRAHLATGEVLARAQQINGGSVRNGDGEAAEDAIAIEITQEVSGDPADTDGQPPDASQQGSTTATAAQTYHATRSTYRPPVNPLADLANAATTLAPFPPVQITTVSGKSGPPHAPSWPSLSEAEIQSDMNLMKLDANDPTIARLTERCYDRPGTGVSANTWRAAGPPDADEQDLTAAADSGLVAGLNAAAIAMARQGSGTGWVGGGVAMSRNTSMMSNDGNGTGVSAADFGWRGGRGRLV